jgi:hypothetical protein
MGSVSIINPKKGKKEYTKINSTDFKTFPPVKILFARMATAETAKKLITRSALFIFRVIKMPAIKTKGAIYKFPTHQLAACPAKKAVMATEIATGLKICFFIMAKIYFEAIARPAAKNKNKIWLGDFIGSIIRARIRAVM